MIREPDSIIQFKNVSKRFGKTLALNDVSLSIAPGTITGLLGANGAGKSTLLRHIVGLYLPDQGSCLTFDREAGELTGETLARIGYVHQDSELIRWMKVGQLLRYVAAYYHTWNDTLVEKLVQDFEVDKRKRVGDLSPGQRQRLAIILAIGFDPELIILDEPVAALDPLARLQFLEFLMDLIQDAGRTIIISSHILSDVEKIIDQALIMKEGGVVTHCPLDDLRESYERITVTALQGSLPDPLPLTGILECERSEQTAALTVRPSQNGQTDALRAAGAYDVRSEPLPLEDLYRLVVTEPGNERGR
jgi:ABC-2 type transport system ATP-binding protein